MPCAEDGQTIRHISPEWLYCQGNCCSGIVRMGRDALRERVARVYGDALREVAEERCARRSPKGNVRAVCLGLTLHEIDSNPAHAKPAYAAPKIILPLYVCATGRILERLRVTVPIHSATISASSYLLRYLRELSLDFTIKSRIGAEP